MRINLGRLIWQTWIGTVVKYPNRVMRFGLGMVIYRIGDCFVADTELKHSQGFSKLAEFPTVLDKSLLVFYAVLSDLRNCGGPFWILTRRNLFRMVRQASKAHWLQCVIESVDGV